VVREQIPVDPRLVIETFPETGRNHPAEIAIAGQVLAEQHQVVGSFGRPAGVGLVESRTGCDIDLAAYDRLDPGVPGLAVEFHRPEHVAVIGHGQGGHAAGDGPLNQIAEPDGPVQKAVLAVYVKMNETGLIHNRSSRWPGGCTGQPREMAVGINL
jgi:hypothetical protein